ncbi:hypothetical protein BGX28_007445 [Mortierella sp. GBA30]|nr:hypothetical protein BGX28_007445 [Mortierella sp. GBA30]
MASYEISAPTTPSSSDKTSNDHGFSADVLTEKLLLFKRVHSPYSSNSTLSSTHLPLPLPVPLPQQQSNSRYRSPSPNRHHRQHQSDPLETTITYPEEVVMRRTPQEALHDVLERIERHQQNVQDRERERELELEMETEIVRRHHHRRINPDLLKDHYHTLKQNHGNANLRHT